MPEKARFAEQEKRARELDALVVKRTAELAAANRNLRRSEALLQQGELLSATGSLEWRPGADEIVWSEQMFALFGMDPVKGPKPELIYERIHPADLEPYKRLIEAGKCGTMEGESYSFRVVRLDGEIRYLKLVWRQVHDGSGELEYLGAVQDVTERRLAEDAAREKDARLYDLREKLAHANRLATLGQLSTSIAHDVRQPLASVLLSASTGKNWLDAKPPNIDAAKRSLERIIKGGERASDILDRANSFARKSGIRKESVMLDGIVEDTLSLVSLAAGNRGIRICTKLGGGSAVIVDRVQIQQVVMNLVINALDAIADVDMQCKEVAIETWQDGEAVSILEVRDTGPGIPELERSKLFDAFFTTKRDGIGMGLAICRDIVQEHGGTLTMSPNAPHGAIFRVTLPSPMPSDSQQTAA